MNRFNAESARQRAVDTLRGLGQKAVAGTALVAGSIGSAMAQSADPTAPIIAEIDKGKLYGVAAAVAFAIAVWAIRAVGMARRKG